MPEPIPFEHIRQRLFDLAPSIDIEVAGVRHDPTVGTFEESEVSPNGRGYDFTIGELPTEDGSYLDGRVQLMLAAARLIEEEAIGEFYSPDIPLIGNVGMNVYLSYEAYLLDTLQIDVFGREGFEAVQAENLRRYGHHHIVPVEATYPEAYALIIDLFPEQVEQNLRVQPRSLLPCLRSIVTPLQNAFDLIGSSCITWEDRHDLLLVAAAYSPAMIDIVESVEEGRVILNDEHPGEFVALLMKDDSLPPYVQRLAMQIEERLKQEYRSLARVDPSDDISPF